MTMAITYDINNHKKYIEEQNYLLCLVLDIEYIPFTKDNYFEIRKKIASKYSGASLKKYNFDLNSIVLAKQLFKEIEK